MSGENGMARETHKTDLQISDEKFEQQYAAAVARGRRRMAKEPSAVDARYDKHAHRIVVELNNGSTFIFPPELAQGLANASAEDLADVVVMPTGYALRWRRLDADFTVTGLLAGIFGTKAWMSELGRKGGSQTSEAKAAAVRENGRKGGRPRTKPRPSAPAAQLRKRTS